MPKFQDVSAKWLAIKDEQSGANDKRQVIIFFAVKNLNEKLMCIVTSKKELKGGRE